MSGEGAMPGGKEWRMHPDERAIRDLVSDWLEANRRGDLEAILGMMAEDVVFLTADRPPMRGRAGFEAVARSAPRPFRLDAEVEFAEIVLHGEWAHAWTRLRVGVTPAEGAPTAWRSGHTLTLFRRDAGRWVLARDANLLKAESGPA